MPPSPDEFEARLRKARGEHDRKTGRDRPNGGQGSYMGLAFRIGVELVAALIVGAGLGLLIDTVFGTAPFGMIAFFLLGAGAGVMNVYRAVSGFGYAVGYRKPDDDGSPLSRRKSDDTEQ